MKIDLLIIGAGPIGCVIAERAASQKGWTSLIVEKRGHIAGNCFDQYHESGVLLHRYGPHYFRTDNPEVYRYLSRFTDWIPGNYLVKVRFRGKLYPMPINLITLEKFFHRKFTASGAKNFLDEIRLPIESPRNSEEYVLSRVGREIYEAFYRGYTLKQWSTHPRDLAPSVCGRIPIRFNRDPIYIDGKWRVTPKDGFTRMFEKMVSRPDIRIMLRTEYKDIKSYFKPRIATVYSGPIDEYFDHRLGALPWRSLEFDFRVYRKPFRQPCVQINYPNAFPYTRTIEIKHVTRQAHPHTVVAFEYPKSKGDPYYPIPAEANERLFLKYQALAQEETRRSSVYFSGRLAQYKYMNTDEAVGEALSLFKKIARRQ